MQHRRRMLFIVVGFLVWQISACGPSRQADANVYANKLAADVEKRVVPQVAMGILRKGPERHDSGIRAEWTFEIPWNRTQYLGWLKTRLTPDFTEQLNSQGELLFTRSAAGDAHSLTIGIDSVNGKLRVRVRLTSYPD